MVRIIKIWSNGKIENYKKRKRTCLECFLYLPENNFQGDSDVCLNCVDEP